MSDEDVTARAAGLAERILDEVSSADQDWGTIASEALDLVALAQSAGQIPIPSDWRGLERIAASFRGVAHPTRLQIVDALRGGGKLSPAQMAASLEPATRLEHVAHHTRALADLGLVAPAGVRRVRGAVQHFYRLSPAGVEMLGMVDRVARFVDPGASGAGGNA